MGAFLRAHSGVVIGPVSSAELLAAKFAVEETIHLDCCTILLVEQGVTTKSTGTPCVWIVAPGIPTVRCIVL